MRTMLELRPEFKPADLKIEDCEALRSADKTALQVKDLEPNESYLHDAALIHISEVLFRHMKLSRRRRTQILSEVDRMRRNHDTDVLTTTQTEIHPLKLVQEDEGNLSGMQQVLHQTMRVVGWNVGDKALPVVGDLLTVNNILSVVAVSEDEPEPINQLKFLAPWSAPWHMLLAWTRLLFRQNYLSDKAGSDLSLDRVREMLNRGKTGLNVKEPQFNEGWALLRHTFEGRLLAAMNTVMGEEWDVAEWTPPKRDFFAACRRLYCDHISPEAVVTAQQNKDQVKAAAGLLLRDSLIGIEYEVATKKGDIGRMAQTERYMLLGFIATGQHNYKNNLPSRALAAKVLPSRALRVLYGASLVNRHGRAGDWEAADHLQETFVKEVKRAAWRQSGSNLGQRLEDRISALPHVSQATKITASAQLELHSKIHVDGIISQGWSKLRNGSLRKFQRSGDALSIREAMLKTVARQSDDEESSDSDDEGAGDDVDDEQWDEADRGLRARLAAERSDGGLLNEM
ncbi:hypothetical protein A4X06_0g7817 [Tilletia controversa]|uniref:DUF6589 domain-containing protein n=1 Tax=Tilletia controversa TaxID=13291 RepID=A0A8X7MLE6_9BASI|nr:hypothetical protein A4X06_0g7817 [Tilletia controversa]